MKSQLHFGDWIVWITVALLQCAVFAKAIHTKLFRLFPSFVWFVGFSSLQTIVLMLVSECLSYGVYFYSYYAGIGLGSALLIVVLFQVYKSSFEPISTLPPGALSKLVISLIGVIVFTTICALWKPASSENFGRVFSFLRTFHRTVDVIVCCSLWAMVLHARRLGIPWRSRMADLVSGFLLYLTVESITTTTSGFVGQPWSTYLSRLGSFSYVCALVVWIAAFRHQELVVTLPSPEELLELKKAWSHTSLSAATLKSLTSPKKVQQ